MKHAETELFLGFISGWQGNHWCSGVSCHHLNWQELPAAPQWHCWMQRARSASHGRILWTRADGAWDGLPGHGFAQPCVLLFTPVQVGRRSHLGRSSPHFASGVAALKALQLRARRSRARERKARGGFSTVTALPPSVHGAAFCLTTHLPALPPEQPAGLEDAREFTFLSSDILSLMHIITKHMRGVWVNVRGCSFPVLKSYRVHPCCPELLPWAGIL